MKNRPRRKWLFLSAVMVLAVSLISAVVFSAKRQQSKIPPRPRVTSLPTLSSQVKDLEIVNARILKPGTEFASIAFEIHNKSNRAVMAVRVVCGNAAISKDGLHDEENPTVVIEPYGTLIAEMSDELTPGVPIVVSAATFEDRKEEGETASLNLLRKIREHESARLKAEKQQAAAARPKQ